MSSGDAVLTLSWTKRRLLRSVDQAEPCTRAASEGSSSQPMVDVKPRTQPLSLTSSTASKDVDGLGLAHEPDLLHVVEREHVLVAIGLDDLPPVRTEPHVGQSRLLLMHLRRAQAHVPQEVILVDPDASPRQALKAEQPQDLSTRTITISTSTPDMEPPTPRPAALP